MSKSTGQPPPGNAAALARLPGIDALLQEPGAEGLRAVYPQALVTEALRAAVEDLRRQIRAGTLKGPQVTRAVQGLPAAAARSLAAWTAPALRPVLNATGVVLHTNLGRAPLPAGALDHVAGTAGGYVNLELDLSTGARGHRDALLADLFRRLTGAEETVVVNNNAAAVLLTLAALARGREVIVSRGELVEIGGSFRIPDVMAESGARLKEIGTTNKTRPADYAGAVSRRTALLMKVHQSNFAIVGFTRETTVPELVAVGREKTRPVVVDLGSGALVDLTRAGVRHEPTVAALIAAGVDLVTFSGDKLLGGPQCGIIVGRRALIEKIRRHPLMRALRVDKLTYAALEAVGLAYLRDTAWDDLPVLAALGQSGDQVKRRAARVVAGLRKRSLPGLTLAVIPGQSRVGGGSAPRDVLPTHLVRCRLRGVTPDALAAALRAHDPPVIARIQDEALVLDLRTVPPDRERALVTALTRAVRHCAGTRGAAPKKPAPRPGGRSPARASSRPE